MEKSNSKVLKGNSAKKTNRETILKLIEDKEGFRNLIAVPRFFIDYTGNLDSAIFLSQLLYWSDNSVRPDGAVYKKYEDWRKEIGLSEYEVKQSVKVLKKKNVLQTKLKKANGAPTLHYYLDLEKLSSSIKEFVPNDHLASGNPEEVNIPNYSNLEMDCEETNDSLTETSTQTITEITYKRESELSDDSFASHSEVDSGDDLNETTKDINDEDATTYDKYWQRMERLESQGISEKPSHIPKDFEPDDNMMFWAKTRFPNKLVGRATEKFITTLRTIKGNPAIGKQNGRNGLKTKGSFHSTFNLRNTKRVCFLRTFSLICGLICSRTLYVTTLQLVLFQLINSTRAFRILLGQCLTKL